MKFTECCVALLIISLALLPLCQRMEKAVLETTQIKRALVQMYAPH